MKSRKIVQKYYERFRETLEMCCELPHLESGEELSWMVYNELDIDVRCDLSDMLLENLMEHNYIYPEIAEDAVRLREMLIEEIDKRLDMKDLSDVWGTEEWHRITALAEEIMVRLYID